MAATQLPDFELNDFTVIDTDKSGSFATLIFEKHDDFDQATKVLKDGENSIGRLDENDIVLKHVTVTGKRHAIIDVISDERRVHVKDLGSTNGTFWKAAGKSVDDKWVQLVPRKVQRLRTGDLIRFGLLVAKAQVEGEEAKTAEASGSEKPNKPPVPFEWDADPAGASVDRPAENSETQAMDDDDWDDEPAIMKGHRKSEHAETQMVEDWDEEETQANGGKQEKTAASSGEHPSEQAETQFVADWDDEVSKDSAPVPQTAKPRPTEQEATQYMEEWDEEEETKEANPPPAPALNSRPSEEEPTQYVAEWDTEEQHGDAPTTTETKPAEDEVTQYVPEWDEEEDDEGKKQDEKVKAREEEVPTQYVPEWDEEGSGAKQQKATASDAKSNEEEAPTQYVPEWDQSVETKPQKKSEPSQQEEVTQYVPEWDEEEKNPQPAKDQDQEEVTQYVPEWDEEDEKTKQPAERPPQDDATQKVELDDYTVMKPPAVKSSAPAHPSEEEVTQAIDMEGVFEKERKAAAPVQRSKEEVTQAVDMDAVFEKERKAAGAGVDSDATDDDGLTQPQPSLENSKRNSPSSASKVNTTLLDSPPSFAWDENDSGSDSDALVSSQNPRAKSEKKTPKKKAAAAASTKSNASPQPAETLVETVPVDEIPETQPVPEASSEPDTDVEEEPSTLVEAEHTQHDEEHTQVEPEEDHTQVENNTPIKATPNEEDVKIGEDKGTPNKGERGERTATKKQEEAHESKKSPMKNIRDSPKKGKKRPRGGVSTTPVEEEEELKPQRSTRAGKSNKSAPPPEENPNPAPQRSVKTTAKRKAVDSVELKTPLRGKKLRSADQLSLRSPHAEDGEPIHIMFSGLEPSAQDKKQIAKINASLLTQRKDYKKVTHLIAAGDGERFKRTPKVMALINCVKFILDISWLHESAKLGFPVREDDFIVVDKELENKYGFNLADTLAASQCDFHVLDDYSILVSDNTCGQISGQPPKTPSETEIRDIVELAGGSWLKPTQKAKRAKVDPDHLILISHPNALATKQGKAKVKELAAAAHNRTAYLPELLFSAVFRQELDFDSEKHILQRFEESGKQPAAAPKKATRRSKKR
mmetsp:Transcript_11044/g.14399  ORF Transcript_11044/g.14399 Transcript_11044/m.14399 type:complete len:1095 (-) Transcript_11044:195-3479(-)